jgi:glycosyltransferase involved in cell wall biosynthesis
VNQLTDRVRVLFSFPNKLGADRICYTAWQQVNGLAAAGAEITVFTGGLLRPVPAGVKVHTTLARGRFRIPYKLIGSRRALALHDWIVSRRIEKLAGQVDIIHTWPLGAEQTLREATRLGIPTVLERPNAHTRFAMDVVQRECKRLGVTLPPDHEHAYNSAKLDKEEEEYDLADCLLCPSDFVVRTFIDRGFPREKLVRHQYGVDEKIYYPSRDLGGPDRGLTMLFVGVCAVRKGLHFALEAWLNSPAHRKGTFLIAGTFLQAYAKKLAPMLSDRSIQVLGHRDDVADLMRRSDILILPTLEEGSALVPSEARACGCVPLVSEAAGAICKHMENGLVHRPGDVKTLEEHITMLHEDRTLLRSLRARGLETRSELTWTAAGVRLLEAYRAVLATHSYRTSHGVIDPTNVMASSKVVIAGH